MNKYPGAVNFSRLAGLKRDDKILILTDKLSQISPIKQLIRVFSSICQHVEIGVLPLTLISDFPKPIKKKIKEFDVIILAASQSWYQAPTRKLAKYKHKKRVIECYGLTLNMIKYGALCADYKKVCHLTRILRYLFNAGDSLKVKTKKGTDFTAKIRSIYEENGFYSKPGSGGNLPAGEISIGIITESMRGSIIFDLSFDKLGRLEKAPLKVFVDKGRIIKVSGRYRRKFDTLLKLYPRMSNVAEVGIGTNYLSIIGHSVLEDEKKLGTVHIGFGNDTYLGGTVKGAHLDGVFSDPTIYVNDKIIMDNGTIANHSLSCLSSR